MAFFYVKSGFGTRTAGGGFVSAQTGTFAALGAANVYDSLLDVYADTTPPVDGDSIYLSHLHNKIYTSNTTLGDGGIRTLIVSVSDTNVASYLIGATESNQPGTNDFRLSGGITTWGLTFLVGDDLIIEGDSHISMKDCTISFNSSLDLINSISFDGTLTLVNTNLIWENGTTGNVFTFARGVKYQMIGGSITATTGTIQRLFTTNSTGGGQIRIVGANLRDINTISENTGGSYTDLFDVEIMDSELSASVSFANEDFVSQMQRLIVVGSGSNAEAEYQYYQRTFGGVIQHQNDTGVFRNESVAFSSGTKVSLQVTTLTTTSLARFLYFKMPSRYVDLSNVSSNVVRIYFASTAALTNAQVWAEIIYPDGTNRHVRNRVTNRVTDILSAGTAHTVDATSDWRNGASALTGFNEYFMDLDTSSNPGADTVPDVFVYVAVPSVTIYFDTTLGVN